MDHEIGDLLEMKSQVRILLITTKGSIDDAIESIEQRLATMQMVSE